MNIKQIQQMMKQAQKMQDNMSNVKDEIDKKEYVQTVGGGVITVTLMGTKELKSIEIKEELLDPEEKDMIEELIPMAINNAIEEIDKETEEKLGPLTSGMPF